MVNSYAVGFACVAAAFAMGTDYVVQSKANGSYPGGYSFTAYLGNYSGRVSDTVAAIDKYRRQSEEARSHLPEAVAGFERRDWERDASRDDELIAGMNILEKSAFNAGLKAARKAARRQVYEYVRGNETIRLSALYVPAPEEGRTEPVEAFMAPGVSLAGARLQGYDIIDGVMFFRVIDMETGLGADPQGPQMLQGFLGPDVAIGVYTEGPVPDLREVLTAIDYDGLNAMLDEPLRFVGSSALLLTEAQKTEFLQAAAPLYAANFAAEAGTAAALPAASAPESPRLSLSGGQALAASQSAQDVSRLSAGTQSATAGAKPGRLTLSGGSSCLSGSSGKFCD